MTDHIPVTFSYQVQLEKNEQEQKENTENRAFQLDWLKLVVLPLFSMEYTHSNVMAINDVISDPLHYIDNSTACPIWYNKNDTIPFGNTVRTFSQVRVL